MENSTHSIVCIGAGNVATNIAKTFHHFLYSILQVYSHTETKAQQLALEVNASYTSSLKEININGDLYIIAVKDDKIAEVIKQLPPLKSIVVHTSGSTPMAVFKNKFPNYGVFYPLQTFSKEKFIDMGNVPICIEANNKKNETLLLNIAQTISKNTPIISSHQRKILHLAAVFVNNFTNHLYSIAEDILNNEDIPFDLLKPLIIETANKIKENSPREVQTGPAKRGDNKIIEEHMHCLQSEDYKSLYQLLSQSIIQSKNER